MAPGEKWVSSTRLALLSKSMEGERTKQRDGPQGDAGMGASACVCTQTQAQQTAQCCKGMGEESKRKR